jgi:CBS domain-containing protein
MKVSDLMQAPVQAIAPDAAVAEVLESLADLHVSALPVVGSGGQLVGIVSSTDVLTAEAEADDDTARERLLRDTLVRDIMTPHPVVIAPDADVHEAAQQMLYADVHRLFVVVEDQLVGVISTTDIVRAVATGLVVARESRV